MTFLRCFISDGNPRPFTDRGFPLCYRSESGFRLMGAGGSDPGFGLRGFLSGGAELGGRFLPFPLPLRLFPEVSMTLRIQ